MDKIELKETNIELNNINNFRILVKKFADDIRRILDNEKLISQIISFYNFLIKNNVITKELKEKNSYINYKIFYNEVLIGSIVMYIELDLLIISDFSNINYLVDSDSYHYYHYDLVLRALYSNEVINFSINYLGTFMIYEVISLAKSYGKNYLIFENVLLSSKDFYIKTLNRFKDAGYIKGFSEFIKKDGDLIFENIKVEL